MAGPSKPPYPQHLNPELTAELRTDVAFFKKWGYLVVEEAITPDQVNVLRAALGRTMERHEGQTVGQLLEEDEGFGFLLDNPPVLARMQALLGTAVQLHSALGYRPPTPEAVATTSHSNHITT